MDLTANLEQIAGKWKQLRGKAKKRWGKATDDKLVQIGGQREILAGKIQEKSSIAKEEVKRQIDE